MSSATHLPHSLTSTELLTWEFGMNNKALWTSLSEITHLLVPRVNTPTSLSTVTLRSEIRVRKATSAPRSVWPALASALISQVNATCLSMDQNPQFQTTTWLRPITLLSRLCTNATQCSISGSSPATTLLMTPFMLKWWVPQKQPCLTLTSPSWTHAHTKAKNATTKVPPLQVYSCSEKMSRANFNRTIRVILIKFIEI